MNGRGREELRLGAQEEEDEFNSSHPFEVFSFDKFIGANAWANDESNIIEFNSSMSQEEMEEGWEETDESMERQAAVLSQSPLFLNYKYDVETEEWCEIHFMVSLPSCIAFLMLFL